MSRPARRAAVATAVGAGLIARGAFLFRRPPWFDEIFTSWICRKDAAGIFAALRFDSGPPLFYLAEAPLSRWAGAGRAAETLRLLPFLAAAALWITVLPRRFSGGRKLALFFAASPLLFVYSGEARAYAPLALLSFLVFLLSVRARPRAANDVALAVCASALLWTHYLGALIVASALVLALAARRWRACAALAAAGVSFLPWLGVALRQPSAAIGWSTETPGRSLLGTIGHLGFAGPIPSYFCSSPLPRAVAAAGVLLGLALLGGLLLAPRCRPSARQAALFAALPLLLAASLSAFRPVYFAGRTELAILPVFLWGVARAARRSRWLSRASAAAILLGSVEILWILSHRPPEPPYTKTARAVVESARPGDLVIAAESNYLPLALARDRGALRARLAGFPREIERHPGWFEIGVMPGSGAETGRLETLAAGEDPGSRVMLAVPPDPFLRAPVDRLDIRGEVRYLRPAGGYAVKVIEIPPAPPDGGR